jgi:hypothetical protein
MNTLICAGGSGTRVLEALVHLCAAGLGPPSMRILVIDPDGANGNGGRVSSLVEKYGEARKRFGNQLGDGLGLFGTELDLLDVGSHRGSLKTWSPVKRNERLREMFNLDILEGTSTPPEVLRLFFTDQELNMDLSEGFRGHPSVGAAAMSLVTLQADQQPWKQLVEKLQGDLAREEGARVFMAGSIFGGTGSATFYPIGRFLRDVPELNRQALKIAVGALSPYFRFGAAEAGPNARFAREAARSELFPLATRGAVDFYDHLHTNDNWPFDVIHWIGDNSPISVPYAPGGPLQKNPAHYVELMTALAAVDFFQAPQEQEGSCYAGSRRQAGNGGHLTLNWDDLPLRSLDREMVRQGLLRFFLAGLVHLGFTGPLVRRDEIERSPERVPWYWQRFISKEDSLATEENRRGLELLDDFFKDFHLPWWGQVHQNVLFRLFNPTALGEGNGVRLDRLANLEGSDRAGEADPDAIDDFYTDMMRVPKRQGGTGGTAAYLALLAHAADRYITREYKKTGIKE